LFKNGSARYLLLSRDGQILRGVDFGEFSVAVNGTSQTLTIWNARLGNYSYACSNLNDKDANMMLVVNRGNIFFSSR